jgi:hypothetical protein
MISVSNRPYHGCNQVISNPANNYVIYAKWAACAEISGVRSHSYMLPMIDCSPVHSAACKIMLVNTARPTHFIKKAQQPKTPPNSAELDRKSTATQDP